MANQNAQLKPAAAPASSEEETIEKLTETIESQAAVIRTHVALLRHYQDLMDLTEEEPTTP